MSSLSIEDPTLGGRLLEPSLVVWYIPGRSCPSFFVAKPDLFHFAERLAHARVRRVNRFIDETNADPKPVVGAVTALK
jgi:hypothetical protein